MRKWKPYGHQRDPGAWIAASGMIPSPTGAYCYAMSDSGYGAATAGSAAAAGAETMANHVMTLPSGASISYTATRDEIWEISNYNLGTFTNRTKAGGYTGGASDYWRFAQYGNISIAVNYIDAVQSRDATGSSDFADLAGSPPKAKLVITQSNAVLLFNYNDGVNAYKDGWWASDIGDHTTWTPASSNEAANGRILQRPGPITAACAFRDEVIVFKANSMFRMRYVGAPAYWTVELLYDGVGADSPAGVCVCGAFITFVGKTGAFIYDGSSLKDIGEGHYSHDGDRTFPILGPYEQEGMYFPATGHVAFIGIDGTNYVRYLWVYNTKSDAWGKATFVWSPVAPTTTLGPLVTGTPNAIETATGLSQGIGGKAAWGSIFFINSLTTANPCVRRANTPASSGSVSGHVIGDERQMTNLLRVTPVWSNDQGTDWTFGATTAYTMTSVVGTNLMALTAGTSVNASAGNYRFDVNVTDRFLYPSITGTAYFEIADLVIDTKPAGTN